MCCVYACTIICMPKRRAHKKKEEHWARIASFTFLGNSSLIFANWYLAHIACAYASVCATKRQTDRQAKCERTFLCARCHLALDKNRINKPMNRLRERGKRFRTRRERKKLWVTLAQSTQLYTVFVHFQTLLRTLFSLDSKANLLAEISNFLFASRDRKEGKHNNSSIEYGDCSYSHTFLFILMEGRWH